MSHLFNCYLKLLYYNSAFLTFKYIPIDLSICLKMQLNIKSNELFKGKPPLNFSCPLLKTSLLDHGICKNKNVIMISYFFLPELFVSQVSR